MLNELLEQMRDPGFYAHEVQAPIEVVQTHISFVVLTGPYAYKIKKPVDLGFLDFTSLDKRHHFCNEELRLNSIFARDLYIEVVPIYECDGHYVLHRTSRDSEVVEYAVRMRQFDASNLLLNIFNAGQFDIEFARRLAAHIANVHEITPVVSSSQFFGSAAAMAESLNQTFESIRPFVGKVIPNQLFGDLRGFMDKFLMKNKRLFEMRLKEGYIRECHGDLHLRNICIFEGRIELFDRIEFSEALKNIDAMYDIAFLLMDVRYRGGHRLANQILNVYLEATGDYGGAQLLPFYMCGRAIIRANVALLSSVDKELDSPRRDEAREDGLRYLEHALEYATPAPGQLVVTCGLSGAGKSTIARTLAERIDAIHIRSDAVRKHLAGVDLTEHGEALYSEAYTRRTYAKLIELGVLLAISGYTVILDAKFDRRLYRSKLIAKAQSFDIPIRFIHCHAPLDVLKTRLVERVGDISDATEELIDSQAASFEPFEGDEAKSCIQLDTQDKNSVDVAMGKLEH